jgi:hypothetical protein
LTGSASPQEASKRLFNLLTDAMGRNARFNALSLLPGHPLFAELGKRLPADQEHLSFKQAMDADRNKWQARSAAVVGSWTALARRYPATNGALMDLMHRTKFAAASRGLSYRPGPFVPAQALSTSSALSRRSR